MEILAKFSHKFPKNAKKQVNWGLQFTLSIPILALALFEC